MSSWYECKIRYKKTEENGKERTANEIYLVDAMSFTEAESRIIKEMEAYISGEFNVTNLKLANYSELVPSEDGDRWFKCKAVFTTIDEEKGKERKTSSQILIHASNVKDAYDKLQMHLSDTISDYEIPSISESPILDIFPVHEDEELEDKIIESNEVNTEFE